MGGRVTLVKTSLKNKLYHGCVGSERVSLQHHCAELLDNGEVVPANSDLRHDYFRRSPLSREDMAQALLLTNSFIKVVLKSHTMPVWSHRQLSVFEWTVSHSNVLSWRETNVEGDNFRMNEIWKLCIVVVTRPRYIAIHLQCIINT